MLANPDLNKPVNLEATEMIMRSPHAYRQMVLDCVLASQRVEGSYQGMDPAKYSRLLCLGRYGVCHGISLRA